MRIPTAAPVLTRAAAGVAAALASGLLLSACGGSGQALTPLNVSQKLEEAKIPCDSPALDARTDKADQIGLSEVSVTTPPSTWLTCDAPGGPYRVEVWDSADDSSTMLKDFCLEDAVHSFYDEQGLDYGRLDADLSRPDAGVGANWVARANEASIVGTKELAEALGGEAKPISTLCTPYEGDVKSLLDSEKKRLGAEAAVQQAQQDEASLAAAMADPVRALLMAGSQSTPSKLLLQLTSSTEDFRVGCALAKNPNMPGVGLATLAANRYTDLVQPTGYKDNVEVAEYRGQVGVCLAENPNTPLEVLQTLSRSQYKDTRRAANAALKQRG